MKKNRGKLILIVASILLSFYFLYPTYKDYKFTKELRSLVGEDSVKYIDTNEGAMREARTKRIKLGLDLQGGMRVVLEVNVLKLIEDVAKSKDSLFEVILYETKNTAATSDQDITAILKSKFQVHEVRMSRYYGNIRDTDDDVVKRLKTESDNAIDRAMEIVRNRVDQYGVSEPSIQKQGGSRIIVELPGVSKEAEVRQLLQGTALLEFKLLIEPEISMKVYESVNKTLAGKPLIDLTSDTSKNIAANEKAKKDNVAKKDSSSLDSSLAQIPDDQNKTREQEAKENPFFALASVLPQENGGWSGELYSAEENKAKVIRILDRPEIKRLIPSDMGFVWAAKHRFIAEGKKYFALYAVKRIPELTGGVIVNAIATIDPNYNTPIVTMEMNSEGSRDWARITGANIQKRIAIIMDNSCFSAPVVQTKIIGGNSQITGMDNIEEAKLLEIVLKAGALPAPVDIIQQTTVGPSLGEDSILKGLWSIIIAFSVTIFFMILYYSTGGAMADIALLLNLLFVLAILAGFQGTLTLPGIAGIILSIAVAVDANVLIYERIREESGGGKTLSASLDSGYTKAFTAIFDSNVTTFITGVVLYQFGSGAVQGFALTLMIGIVASMFSSIVITRVIFEIMIERNRSISFG
ncbi:MAG: protein translocase subunit SecD [Ignavibacteriales bacterium]|nr:protein translocase subunit SecD [Ignavibacteriales bacterium]